MSQLTNAEPATYLAFAGALLLAYLLGQWGNLRHQVVRRQRRHMRWHKFDAARARRAQKSLATMNKSLRETITRLEERNSELRDERSQLTADIQSLKGRVDSLKRDLAGVEELKTAVGRAQVEPPVEVFSRNAAQWSAARTKALDERGV